MKGLMTMITFTEEELYNLRLIIKVEVDDTKELIENEDNVRDKRELKNYLKIIESIQQKLK